MINVADYLSAAAAKVDPGTWCYFEGGAGDEVTLRANELAFGRWLLRPRMLVDVAEISLATTVLGTPIAMPVGIAPFAMQRLLDPDGELATARAAAMPCVSGRQRPIAASQSGNRLRLTFTPNSSSIRKYAGFAIMKESRSRRPSAPTARPKAVHEVVVDALDEIARLQLTHGVLLE